MNPHLENLKFELLCQKLLWVLLLYDKIWVFLGIKLKNLVLMWVQCTEQLYVMQIFWNCLGQQSTFRSNFSQTCRRQRLSCKICTNVLLIIICYFNLLLLKWRVSMDSHILLLVKGHAYVWTVIESKIKWKSLYFLCYVSVSPFVAPLIHSLVCGNKAAVQTQNNITPNATQTN